MASASNYLEGQLGNHILRTGSFTKPSALYLALFTTKPAEDGTGGVEVSGAGYARIACGPADASWAEPVSGNGEFVNLVDFTFGSPTEDWAADPDYIVAFGIYDASTSGNLLIFDDLSDPQEVLSGSTAPEFSAGDLSIAFG